MRGAADVRRTSNRTSYAAPVTQQIAQRSAGRRRRRATATAVAIRPPLGPSSWPCRCSAATAVAIRRAAEAALTMRPGTAAGAAASRCRPSPSPWLGYGRRLPQPLRRTSSTRIPRQPSRPSAVRTSVPRYRVSTSPESSPHMSYACAVIVLQVGGAAAVSIQTRSRKAVAGTCWRCTRNTAPACNAGLAGVARGCCSLQPKKCSGRLVPWVQAHGVRRPQQQDW